VPPSEGFEKWLLLRGEKKEKGKERKKAEERSERRDLSFLLFPGVLTAWKSH